MVGQAHSLDRFAVVVALVFLLAVVQGFEASSAGATVTGEDGRIAYVSEVDGDVEIYSVNPDGTDAVNLTNTLGTGLAIDDMSPAWSPDGRWIAFTRAYEDVDAEEPTMIASVWWMSADGTNQTELVREGFHPAWSPDGRSIAFAMPSMGVENGLSTTVISVLDLKTDTTKILTDPGTWTDMGGDGTSNDKSPVWSPDGSTIYFVRSRMPATPLSFTSEIMAVDVVGGTTTSLELGERHIWNLDVSPGGRTLVSTDQSLPNPPRSVVLRDLLTLERTSVVSGYDVARGSGFSPSGDRVTVTLTDGPMTPPSWVWTMNLDGSDRVRVAKGSDPAWQPVNPYPVGLVDPTSGQWHLRYPDGYIGSFYYGNPGDVAFLGDWDCDGVDTPGLYRQDDGYVYLRDSNTQGVADLSFFFGNPGDEPLAGDFNGDGCDTVSLYRPTEQRFYIMNHLGDSDDGLGAADYDYVFGNPGDTPFAGDFDGDGIETAGLHRPTTGLVYYRNTHTQGIADHHYVFGDPADRFITNDWNHDGHDTPAVFRPSNTTHYFRFTNTQGLADAQFIWGNPDWYPVTGTLTSSDPRP